MAGIERISPVNKDPYDQIPAQKIQLAPAGAAKPVDIAELKKAVAAVNAVADPGTKLAFGVEEGISWVKVLDGSTGNVIRQIPPRDMIDMWLSIRQTIKTFLSRNQ